MRFAHLFLAALLVPGAHTGWSQDDASEAVIVVEPRSRICVSVSSCSSDLLPEASRSAFGLCSSVDDVCCCGRDAEFMVGHCGPTWTITLDTLFLQRQDPAATDLIVNTNTPGQSLNASDFHNGSETGLDVSILRSWNDSLGIEARYFGLNAWCASSIVATTPGDTLSVQAAYPLLTAAGDSIRSHYRSELNDFELNARLAFCDWLTVVGGFRYLELDERFHAAVTNAATPFDYDTTTRNRLYGAQLGGDVLFWNSGDWLSIEGTGKAGVFGNASVQDSAFDTGTVRVLARDTRSPTAFVGEVALSATCRLTERLSVRSGYRLLWVDGVALASDQVAATDFLFNRGINASGDTFYHGAFVGLQYAR